MAARPRSSRKRGWPEHLYERSGYFSYLNPLDGKEYGLGRDRAKAMSEARAANNYVATQRNETGLVDRITGTTETFDTWLDQYAKLLGKRKLADNTRRSLKTCLTIARTKLGAQIMRRITTRMISDVLAQWSDAGKDRMALSLWTFLFDAFMEAEGAGWIDRGHNPVEVATKPIATVRRMRLTLEAYNAIYAQALKLDPWVSNSMALALVTAQRREDVAEMQFPHIRDGHLFVEQHKTSSKLCIPIGLRLDVVQLSVEGVVKRCRDNVVSRYLVHHTVRRTKSDPGDQVWIDTISKGFARARELAGIEVPAGKTAPTFHELRSLAERLYKAQGVDTQTLLGHKDPRTTATYHDSRGDEWVTLKLPANWKSIGEI